VESPEYKVPAWRISRHASLRQDKARLPIEIRDRLIGEPTTIATRGWMANPGTPATIMIVTSGAQRARFAHGAPIARSLL